MLSVSTDIQQASSFNMPFTTMNNYNWLLNIESAEQNTLLNRTYQQVPTPELYSATIGGTWSGQPKQSQSLDILESASSFTSSLRNTELLNELSIPNQAVSAMTESFQAHFTQTPATDVGVVASSSHDTTLNEHASGIQTSHYHADGTAQKPISEYRQTQIQKPSSRSQQRNIASNRLQAFRTTSHSRNLPTVDEVSRAQVLDIILQSSPQTPDGTVITHDHHLLTLSSLQNYCDLFFSRFNISYPLLHQATFEVSKVNPLLLISVILLGATYADKASHRLAVCIHDELRAKIFQNSAFKAQPTLWMLQTILLVECFGKSRAGQSQHDMAHLFHGLLIKYVAFKFALT